VGTATIAKAAYPDATQFDPKSDHYDAASKKDDPRWFVVDVKLDHKFARAVPLAELRDTPALEGMVLLRKGSRLSVQPVTPAEWKVVCKLGDKA
jgi:predicted RNA-binding protein with PUA-like domain